MSGTAPTGYQTFSAAMSINDTCFYAIQHQTLGEWEVGLGTYSSSNTLTRTTIIASSNSGSVVTFSAGTKDIWINIPATKNVQLDNNNNATALGTPASGTLTNCTGLPISTGVSGLGTGVATFLATPSSANLASAVTNETGSGALVFGTSPTLTTPLLGTPTSGVLTNCTGYPVGSLSGLGTNVATALGNATNGANGLLQLDASGLLPAEDGSQLTNLPGSRVLLTTLTASNSASLAPSTSLLTSTYSIYHLVFDRVVPVTSTDYLIMKAYAGGYASSGYTGGCFSGYAGSTTTQISSTTINICGSGSAINNGFLSGSCYIINPSSGYTIFEYGFVMTTTSNGHNITRGLQFYNSSTAVTGFQVYANTGNVSSGTIKVYGIK